MTNPEPCDEWVLLIQAELDGELSPAEAARVVAHAAACHACSTVRRELSELSAALRSAAPRYPAPPQIRGRLRPRLAPLRAASSRGAVGVAAGAALAAALMLALLPAPPATGDGDAALDAHLRALLPGRLVDVPSSDRHTVKPWFDGRLDFIPPVRDFAAAGFPLEGGRVDYLGGRAVAVLVYRRRQHAIDLFVAPAPDPAAVSATARRGFHELAWAEDGFAFRAVSDLGPDELAAFARLWRGAAD